MGRGKGRRKKAQQPKPVKDQRPWTTWLIECRRDDGTFEASYVLELLQAHRSDARNGVQKMERMQNLGWEEARTKLLIEGGRRAIVRPDKEGPAVWELKTNPHRWRFYFEVDEANRYFIYAYVTYKKKTEADRGDVVSARKYIARLRGGTARRAGFNFSQRHF